MSIVLHAKLKYYKKSIFKRKPRFYIINPVVSKESAKDSRYLIKERA